MLETLRKKYGVRTVACEGGPTLFRSLLEQGLIDRLNLTIAPYMFGGAKAPTLTGLSKKFLPASVQCSLSGMRTIGDECFLTYQIRHQPTRRKYASLCDAGAAQVLLHSSGRRNSFARRNPCKKCIRNCKCMRRYPVRAWLRILHMRLSAPA